MLSLFERRKKENISIETSLHNNVIPDSNKSINKPTPIQKNSNISYLNKTYHALLNNNDNNFKRIILQNQNS